MLLLSLFAVVIYCGWELVSGAASSQDHSVVDSYDAVHASKGRSHTGATDLVSEVAAGATSVFAASKLVPAGFGNGDRQGPAPELARIQHEFDQSARAHEQRLAAVKEAFEHS